jgi:hypothetical protein
MGGALRKSEHVDVKDGSFDVNEHRQQHQILPFPYLVRASFHLLLYLPVRFEGPKTQLVR